MKTLNLVDLEKSNIKYKISKFPDGQQQVSFNFNSENPCVEQVFNKVQIKSRLNNFQDLELIICATKSLRNLGVKEIHLYTPYFLGSRSDRQFEEGSNNYLKDVICPIINSLGLESVTVLDPHSDVLEACLNGFKKVSNRSLIDYALSSLNIDTNKFVLISPDAGALKKIYKVADSIGYKGDIITCSKSRDSDGKLSKTIVPLGTLKQDESRDYIIIDDICDGGATFINIAKEIKQQYSKAFTNKGAYFDPKIYLIVTHGIFSKGFEELEKYFDGIYCTNSYGQLRVNVESGYKGLVDEWIGSTEEQYYPEIPKGLVKQLNIF